MADVDTSIYPKYQNPLTTLSGFANLQNVMNQNRLFQQQFQTNLGMARAYKEALNPDGTVNYPALFNLAKQDPNVALGMGQIVSEGQRNQEQVYRNQILQLDNARQHLDAISGYLSPIAKLGSKATSADVVSALAHAGTVGLANPQEQASIYATLPRLPNGQVNEAEIPNWVQAQQLAVQDKQSRLQALYPAPVMTPTPGGGQAPYVFPQVGQVQQVGPTSQPQAGPTTQIIGPNGQPRYVGAPAPNPYELEYQQRVQGLAGAPASPSVVNAPASPQARPAPQGSNVAGMQSDYAPGQREAMAKTGGASADQLSGLREEVHGSANRILMSQQAIKALEGATTGKGSQPIQNWRSVLTTLSIGTPGNDSATMSFDEAKKYMLGAMLSRGAGLGINTNEKLAALSGASASTDITKMAATDILRVNIGLEKAQQAQLKAFDRTGLPAEKFSKWAADWASNRDLRVYALADKSAAEKQKFIGSLKPGERKKFSDTLREAVDTDTLPMSDFTK
jgi:hypothetical protein